MTSMIPQRFTHTADSGPLRRPALTSFFEQLALSGLDRMIIDDLMRYAPDKNDTALLSILGLLFAALGDGSLCIDLDHASQSARLGEAQARLAKAEVTHFIVQLEAGVYDRLVHRCDLPAGPGDTGFGPSEPFKPLVLDIIHGRRLLYFQKFHFHERRLTARLSTLLSKRAAARLSDRMIDEIVETLYAPAAVIRKGPALEPIVRDPYQEAAIRSALIAPLMVISGGPGTGKTSLLVNILRGLVRTGVDPLKIMLAAPTGRAAQRMTEALTNSLSTIRVPDEPDRKLAALSGATLHKLLVYRRHSNSFLYDANRPIPAEVVAVDEVSMVDVVMMDHLFQAIDPNRTRLILLGDKDQLPSVDAGSVMADMPHTLGGGDTLAVLNNVYRSSGGLTELSRAINTGTPLDLEPIDFDSALHLERHAWGFVHAGDGPSFARQIDHWIDLQYGQAVSGHSASFVECIQRLNALTIEAAPSGTAERSRLLNEVFDLVSRCRILSAQRHGQRGARAINAYIAGSLRHILDPDAAGADRLFAGAVLMITRNDYRRKLFNGDIGIVLPHGRSAYQVYFRRGTQLTALAAYGLPDWDLAYAMTVHKSQGSEFEDVWLVLPDDPHHRLLTREIIYTAATRAAHRLIIDGTPAALRNALTRKIVRQSGMVIG